MKLYLLAIRSCLVLPRTSENSSISVPAFLPSSPQPHVFEADAVFFNGGANGIPEPKSQGCGVGQDLSWYASWLVYRMAMRGACSWPFCRPQMPGKACRAPNHHHGDQGVAWECGRLETANTVTRPPPIIATVNTVRVHTNSHRAGSSRNRCRESLMQV